MSDVFAPNARKIWEAIPMNRRARVLSNVWCSNCRKATTIVNYFGQLKDGNLVLEGDCEQCGKTVARLIESE
jgi:hypothetical protein